MQHEYEQKIKEVKLKQWVREFRLIFFIDLKYKMICFSVLTAVKKLFIIVVRIHHIVMKHVNINTGLNILKHV